MSEETAKYPEDKTAAKRAAVLGPKGRARPARWMLALGLAAAVGIAGVATLLAYPKLAPAKVVGLSEVKANPEEFLGRVTITGKTGNAYPDQGVLEIVDEKACCNLFLSVPFHRSNVRSSANPRVCTAARSPLGGNRSRSADCSRWPTEATPSR